MKFLSFILNFFTSIERKYNKISSYYVYFLTLIQLLNISYIIIFFIFGVKMFDNTFITKINFGLQILVCSILLLKFHPFRKHELHDNDGTIIFGSAVFIMVNLGIMEYINYVIYNVEDTITKMKNNMNI